MLSWFSATPNRAGWPEVRWHNHIKAAQTVLGDSIAIETIVIAGLCGSALGDLVLQVHFEEQVWQHGPCADIVICHSLCQIYERQNKHVFKWTVRVSFECHAYKVNSWQISLRNHTCMLVHRKLANQKCSLQVEVCWHVFGGQVFVKRPAADSWNFLRHL